MKHRCLPLCVLHCCRLILRQKSLTITPHRNWNCSTPTHIQRFRGIGTISDIVIFLKKMPFLILSTVQALERVEVGGKIADFQITECFSFFLPNKFFETFLQYNAIPAGFNWILTNIWSISFLKTIQLQETEMRRTGWTSRVQCSGRVKG